MQTSSPLQLLSKLEKERCLSYTTSHLLFQKGFGEHLLKLEIRVNAENFPGGSDGKESACNARDLGSIPGLGRSPEMATHSSILAWRILWTEEPDGLQSMESQSWT